MGLGIGLGAFAGALKEGYGLGRQIAEDSRAERNRAALDRIETDARTQFDARVADGNAGPGDFDTFWTSYALPRRAGELLRQGDVAGAQALKAWGETEEARAGGKLFASAMLKAQTGDPKGALEDAIKAGQIQGYIAGGYEVQGQEEIVDSAGTLVGFRLKVKGPDGSVREQDIPVADIPRVIATFLSPDAAYQTQVEARSAQTKRTEELEDYATKKQVDATFAKGAAPTRQDAIKALSEAYPATEGLPGQAGDPGFLGFPEERQNELIERWMRMAGSSVTPLAPAPTPSAPRKVVVDSNTGEQVPVPGLGSGAQAPVGASSVGLGERKWGNATVNGVEDPALPAPDRPIGKDGEVKDPRQSAIEEAATLMTQGANHNDIARRLLNAGVPQAQWPRGLTIGTGR